MGIFLIITAGIILRLLFIVKGEGLWNDEYVSYMIASVPFNNGFASAVKTQCHMPFYYLYLKFFMNFFTQSDTMLRLTSVLPGVLSIPVMYLTGKEKNKQTGLMCALITAISAFLIYYSQEVRFYSLLFLFSSFSLLFTLKLTKEVNTKNLAGWIISSLMILFTHTIGFVYVFFNLLFLSILLYKTFKRQIIILWTTITGFVLLLSPIIIKILTFKTYAQWWGHFTPARYGFLLTDFFSPVLTNLVNAPDYFFKYVTVSFTIFALVPAIIGVIWIINSLHEKKEAGLIAVCLGTVFVLTIAAVLGKLVFITKYSIEIYPILIYLAGTGAVNFQNKILKNSLIVIYCTIHLFYYAFSSNAPFRIPRKEGNALAVQIIQKADIKPDDMILIQYYPPERFKKYLDFSNYRVVSIDKGNFAFFLTQDIEQERNTQNKKDFYRGMLSNGNNPFFESQVNKIITDNLKQGQSVLVLTLGTAAFMTSDEVQKTASDVNEYEKTPLLFMIFSFIQDKTYFTLSKKLQVTRFIRNGAWSGMKFTKVNK